MILMKKLRKIQLNYKKIILDFIPAFLGVLVALILSNWNEQRKENEFIKKSIVSIYTDNKENIEHANWELKELKSQLDTFEFYLNDSLSIMELVIKNHGISMTNYIQSGWKILENSQLVTKIDYELLTLLNNSSSDIEYWQTSYKDKISNILYNSVESKSRASKERLIVILRDSKIFSKDFKITSEKIDSILTTKYKKVLRLDNQ